MLKKCFKFIFILMLAITLFGCGNPEEILNSNITRVGNPDPDPDPKPTPQNVLQNFLEENPLWEGQIKDGWNCSQFKLNIIDATEQKATIQFFEEETTCYTEEFFYEIEDNILIAELDTGTVSLEAIYTEDTLVIEMIRSHDYEVSIFIATDPIILEPEEDEFDATNDGPTPLPDNQETESVENHIVRGVVDRGAFDTNMPVEGQY
jgi:hypothetical protein